MARAIADLQLMLHQHRFGHDCVDAAGAKEFCQRDDKMKDENNEIAHGIEDRL